MAFRVLQVAPKLVQLVALLLLLRVTSINPVLTAHGSDLLPLCLTADRIKPVFRSYQEAVAHQRWRCLREIVEIIHVQ